MKEIYRNIFNNIHATEELRHAVETIPQQPHKQTSLRLTPILSVCLAVLCTISVVAVGRFLTKMTVKPVVLFGETVGYDIVFPTPRRKLTDFSTQLQQDAVIMAQAKKESALYFDGWKDVESYLGFSVLNPLEHQDWLTRGSHCAFRCDCTSKNAHCQVYLEGGTDGQIVRVTTTAGYRSKGLWVLLTGWIDTEYMSTESASLTHSHYYHDPMEYTVEEVTTPSGFDGVIVRSNAYDSRSYEAYILCDNICYRIEILAQYGSTDPEAFLKQLCACF